NLENVAVRDGSEEYLNSEKYEAKTRALHGELLPLIGQINFIRRENPALQSFANITFLDTANEALIAYAKQAGQSTILTVVNLDPHQPQEGLITVPAGLGVAPSFTAHDLLSDERFQWRIGPNYVRLVPTVRQSHVIRVES
ncbi:MAG TPA: hypothetical protein VGI44_15020, partial [Acidimicrobiales bacterium]